MREILPLMMLVDQKDQRKSSLLPTAISAHVHFFASSSVPEVVMSLIASFDMNKKSKKRS